MTIERVRLMSKQFGEKKGRSVRRCCRCLTTALMDSISSKMNNLFVSGHRRTRQYVFDLFNTSRSLFLNTVSASMARTVAKTFGLERKIISWLLTACHVTNLDSKSRRLHIKWPPIFNNTALLSFFSRDVFT